jgi:hypothetical protein
MVVGDHAGLVGDAELPVEPDPGGQGQQPLGDLHPQPLRVWAPWRSSPSWSFRVSMMPSIHWRIPPSDPHRCGSSRQLGRTSTAPSWSTPWANRWPARPLSAAMTIPGRSSPWSLANPSSAAATSRSPSLGWQDPGHRHAVRGRQQVQLEASIPARVAPVIAVAGPAGQVTAPDRLPRGAARHRGGVQQPPLVPPRRRGAGQVLQRQPQRWRGGAQPPVVPDCPET